MMQRDQRLLNYLTKFRVLSRDHVGKLVASECANPSATATRICKRLSRDGYLTIIPQPRDKPYLYMPNPTIIHPHSTRIEHFLAIVDLYTQLNRPEHFDVEPQFGKYQPDVYATLNGVPVIIEVQRTRISNRRMQAKIDEFMRSFYRGEHRARAIWIYAAEAYNVKIQAGFQLKNGLFRPNRPE